MTRQPTASSLPYCCSKRGTELSVYELRAISVGWPTNVILTLRELRDRIIQQPLSAINQ